MPAGRRGACVSCCQRCGRDATGVRTPVSHSIPAAHPAVRRLIREAARLPVGTISLTGTQRKLLLLTSRWRKCPLGARRQRILPAWTRAEAPRGCSASARDCSCASAAAADVLIIEDEPIIAMDIEELVAELRPPGRGGCRDRGRRRCGLPSVAGPGLILADINLGAGGDGTLTPYQPHPATATVRPGDLRDRLPRAAADRRSSRAGLRHNQAVRTAYAWRSRPTRRSPAGVTIA